MEEIVFLESICFSAPHIAFLSHTLAYKKNKPSELAGFVFCFVVLETGPIVSCMVGKCFTTDFYPQSCKIGFNIQNLTQVGSAAHTIIPVTWKTNAGGVQTRGQPGQHSKTPSQGGKNY